MGKKAFAKVEIIKNIKEIKKLRDQGHTKKNIYETMLKKGKITMCYSNFCEYDLTSGNRRIRKK